MQTRYFALIFGIVYALVGVLGFIPGMVAPPPPEDLSVTAMSGHLMGLFPVNILHSLVHLAVGVWGVIAYRTFEGSRIFARAVAVIFGLLTVFGLIPGLHNMFGLVPLHGNDVWLHALTTVIAAYFGWRAPSHATATTAPHH